MEQPRRIATFSELIDHQPVHAEVNGLDLVITRFDDKLSVLYGRCLHRGALMSDGHVSGDDLICGLHGWDYRLDSSVSAYNNSEVLHKFSAKIEDDGVWVDEAEINSYLEKHPNPLRGISTWGSMPTPTRKIPSPLPAISRSSPKTD